LALNPREGKNVPIPRTQAPTKPLLITKARSRGLPCPKIQKRRSNG
jgi:hypothetical protein